MMAACTYAMAPDQKDAWQDGRSSRRGYPVSETVMALFVAVCMKAR